MSIEERFMEAITDAEEDEEVPPSVVYNGLAKRHQRLQQRRMEEASKVYIVRKAENCTPAQLQETL